MTINERQNVIEAINDLREASPDFFDDICDIIEAVAEHIEWNDSRIDEIDGKRWDNLLVLFSPPVEST